MNYLFITTYYWIDIEAFKSILSWINNESNCDLKNQNWIESSGALQYPVLELMKKFWTTQLLYRTGVAAHWVALKGSLVTVASWLISFD